MTFRPFLLLSLAAALPAAGQQAPPSVPAAAETGALNTLKQDLRNKEDIRKAAKDVMDKALENEAAKKELDRLKKDKGAPSAAEAKKRLGNMAGEIDEKARKELKSILENSREAFEEDVKKAAAELREKMRREGKTRPEAPVPEVEDPAGGFENIPVPGPPPLRRAPVFKRPPISADRMIKGPSRDPKDPGRELPETDPRTRTYILTGKVAIRFPEWALDADEVDILFKAGAAPGEAKEKKSGPPAADPVSRPKRGESPIERIIARGRVRFMFVDKTGNVQAGRGGSMIYEENSGWFVIKDWPEAEFAGKLARGPSKNSVMRMSRLGEADVQGCQFFTVEKELTVDDLPKTPDTPVPGSSAVLPSGASVPPRAPAPASR